MPRAASTSTEEKTVKKAPRKRAVSKSSTTTKKATPRKTTDRKASAKKTTPRKTSSRTAATKQVDEEVYEADARVFEAESSVESTMPKTRKAPTEFATAKAAQRSKRTQFVVISLLILLGVGASAAVGLSDSEAGQINVAQTIKERNERMANLVDVNGPTVIVPTPSQVPDGGLIGVRPADSAPAAPSTPPATASSTATSTAATTATSTATSTDDVIGSEGEVDATPPSPAEMSATDTATTTVEAIDATSTDNNL